MPPFRRVQLRWWLWLGAWTAVGLAIRLETVLSDPDKVAGGDAYAYYSGAHLLVSGHGFINPFIYAAHGSAVQTASYPPLFILLLGAVSAVGLKSFLAARLWCCVLGASAVVVVGGAGREIAGRRVGLLAAFLVAVYPNIWMSDELALSETIAPTLVAAVLWCAYRFWKRPGTGRAAALGVVLGVTILGRDELTLLGLFILVPLVLLVRSFSARRRLATLGVALLAVAIVVGPWVGFNHSRFDRPVFVTTGLGVTLSSADCPSTWSGPYEGYWSMPCALHYASEPSVDPNADESVQSAQLQQLVLDYIRDHTNRLVPVTLAKEGRGFGFFHPLQQLHLDSYVETRPFRWAVTGLVAYYALLALAVGGTVVLRRRRIPSFPMWAIGLNVACSMALTFGQTRYRTTFEVSLVLLAAVQLDAFWSRLDPTGRGRRVLRSRASSSHPARTDGAGPAAPATAPSSVGTSIQGGTSHA